MTVRTAVATDDGWSSRLLIVAHAWTAAGQITEALDGTNIDVVHVVGSQAEAIALLEHTHVDVVVVRVGLPDSRGAQLAREIHFFWPTIGVVMCGPEDDELIIEALDAGVGHYVAEDVELATIVDTIERAARHE